MENFFFLIHYFHLMFINTIDFHALHSCYSYSYYGLHLIILYMFTFIFPCVPILINFCDVLIFVLVFP